MSEIGKAVFLSYASQDTAAAKHIADALRSAGVEVWFDQEGGLEHGDEWDAKIRRQIRECVLFLPLISANTQARHEGYFRIEWELAAQRALGIASGVPFILPVVIDGTREPDALVPDRFRIVQWTKLAGGVVPPDVLQRFLKLWSHRTGVLNYEAAQASSLSSADAGKKPALPEVGRPLRGRRVASIAAIVVVLVAGVLVFQNQSKITPPEAARRSAPPAAPVSEARQLVAKAEELILALDSTRDDFALAEDMLKQAIAKAPADAEVWAAYSYLHQRYGARGWDPTNERREQARAAVQRALRLDPKSFEARFMSASLYTGTSEKDNREHEQALRALLKERPDDKRVIRALAATLRYLPNRTDEIIELYDRAASLPGGDPLALYNKALALWFSGRVKEADAAVAAAIAQEPFQSARLLAAYLALTVDGDLDRAKRLLEELPTATLQDDRGCFFGYLVYVYRGEPDQALAVLRSFPRDWLNDSWYHGPKGLLTGNALAYAGRQDAAAVEWRAALKIVDVRLAANPNYVNLLGTRVLLLAKLGDLAAAREQLPAVRQMLQSTKYGEIGAPWYTQLCVAMGDRAEALRIFGVAIHSKQRAVTYPASDLRYDPEWKPLRNDPEFIRLLAEADRLERVDAGGPPAAAPAPNNADAKSVAVLAFTNLSDDKANEYFSDGISEELLTVLQKIPGLHVAARTSAFSFKGKDATAQEIGEKLGVATLVEGSVRKAGNSVRITARLSRAATGEQLWSESYTRELKDVFAVQEELALAIVGELRGRLTGESTEAVRAAVKGGTRVPEAHQQYLLGRFEANRYSEKAMETALANYQRAVELDPKFALAWAELSQAHLWFCNFSTVIGREGFEAHRVRSKEAADRALALEPELPEGLLARAAIQGGIEYNWKAAGESLRVARALAPANPAVVTAAGNLASALGDMTKSIELFQQAAVLDPVNPVARSYLAYQLMIADRFDEAKREYARVVELSPEAPWAHAGLGMAYLLRGSYEEAAAEAQHDAADWARLLVVALARWSQKRIPESDAALAELTKDFADTAAYQIAEIHAYRGEKDQAFAWLERARQQHDGGINGLMLDPLLKNLLSDPRWPVVLKSLGFDETGATK